MCEEHLVQLKANERWSDRFLEELEARLEPTGGKSWWTVVQKELDTIWVYEIAEVNDQPITVGKIVKLIVYMFLGVLLASILSRLLGRRVLPRFGLNEGASHAVQSIAFYSLAALFGVLSFEFVHIPLTAFAFLGGAVAIAVGFGSQDIANNFMSGIIILAEQPIRVGDVVVVDDVQGTVMHIGPRSTRINTDANHEVIVPNSKLLSDKVTNLTLSDSLIQTAVARHPAVESGGAAGKEILLQAATSHPTVLQEPRPIVLFKQFGTRLMDFELHFWLQAERRHAGRHRAERRSRSDQRTVSTGRCPADHRRRSLLRRRDFRRHTPGESCLSTSPASCRPSRHNMTLIGGVQPQRAGHAGQETRAVSGLTGKTLGPPAPVPCEDVGWRLSHSRAGAIGSLDKLSDQTGRWSRT